MMATTSSRPQAAISMSLPTKNVRILPFTTRTVPRPFSHTSLTNNSGAMFLPLLRGNSRKSAVVAAAASPASTVEEVQEAVELLKKAAADGNVAPVSVFQALRTLEKAKMSSEEWPEVLGGSVSPGKRWRLVFTSGTKQVQEAMKGVGKGGGQYFPLTAVQRWDSATGEIENGIFLGYLAALTFSGPYAFKGKKLQFDFDTLKLKLGGAKFSFNLKKKIENYQPGPKDPFFLFFYVDEDIVAARGRGGGIAFWARTTPKWELEKGVA